MDWVRVKKWAHNSFFSQNVNPLGGEPLRLHARVKIMKSGWNRLENDFLACENYFGTFSGWLAPGKPSKYNRNERIWDVKQWHFNDISNKISVLDGWLKIELTTHPQKLIKIRFWANRPHFWTFQIETDFLSKSELTTRNILRDTSV